MKRAFSLILSAVLLMMPVSGFALAAKYERLFDKASVLEIDFEVDEALWQHMLDHAMTKEVICCNMTVNGERYYSVGVNCKGNSSLAQTQNDRYSLRVTFDEYVHQQSLMGLDKILLNNMYADRTYMKEFLSYELFDAMGVPVPLHAFARVTVNGRDYGFMLALEAMEDDYEARVFGTESGHLYKVETMDMNGMGLRSSIIPQERQRRGAGQGFWSDFSDRTRPTVPSAASTPETGGTETENGLAAKEAVPGEEGQAGDAPFFQNRGNGNGGFFGAVNGADLMYTDDRMESYSAIFNGAEDAYTSADAARVISALKTLKEGTDEEVAGVFDIDGLLRYFAVNTVLVNTDHYTGTTAHNYYLYENKGRLTLLPWDYNLSFGGFVSGGTSGYVNFPIDTPVDGVSLEERPLLKRLLGNAEWLADYHTYLEQALAWFEDGTFENRVKETEALITAGVQAQTNPFCTFEEYQEAVPALVECVRLRAESVRGQLEGTIPSGHEGQNKDPGALVGIGNADLSLLGTLDKDMLPPTEQIHSSREEGSGSERPLQRGGQNDSQTGPGPFQNSTEPQALSGGSGEPARDRPDLRGTGSVILLAALTAMMGIGLFFYKRKG